MPRPGHCSAYTYTASSPHAAYCTQSSSRLANVSSLSFLFSLQVPLFQNTEIGFTKLLALSINPVLFLSKEYVVRKGDIGSEVGHYPTCACGGSGTGAASKCSLSLFLYPLPSPPPPPFQDVFHQPWYCGSCQRGWECGLCHHERREVLWGDQSHLQLSKDSIHQVPVCLSVLCMHICMCVCMFDVCLYVCTHTTCVCMYTLTQGPVQL